MNRKGWLSREDFDALDTLFGKLGYGGYYDFLECLKEVASNIGAFNVEGGEIDRSELKTIPDVMKFFSTWAYGIMDYRIKTAFKFDSDIMEIIKKRPWTKKGDSKE